MSARVRWGSLIPRSRIDSNAMVIWWGCAGGNRAFNDIFRDLVIGFLLDDMGIATGAAPRASVLASRQSADLQIAEQHRRARSSGDQATLCVDGWVQVLRERGHHDRWHRAGPSHSQGTILVWPRLSAPWLVEEGRMDDGTRVGTGSEKTRASSRPKYPSMHQNPAGPGGANPYLRRNYKRGAPRT